MSSSPARLRSLSSIALGAMGVGAIAGASLALANRNERVGAGEWRSWPVWRRGLFVAVHHERATAVACLAVLAAIGAFGLAWVMRRTRNPWPLFVAAAGAIVVLVVVRLGQGWAGSFEPRGYRSRSRYVRAADALGTLATVGLLALVLLFVATVIVERRSAGHTIIDGAPAGIGVSDDQAVGLPTMSPE